MELVGPTVIITFPIGALIQKTGESFKDEDEKRSMKDVCMDVSYGTSKYKKSDGEKYGNLSSEESVSKYENKLNSCIKSYNIHDFDATIAEQWNREDIKSQLNDCHTRIKNNEIEFKQKNTQEENKIEDEIQIPKAS